MLRVLIADDHPYLVEGFRSIVSEKENCIVSGTVNNGEQVISFVEQAPVNIVLMDIRMPKMSGIEATKILSEKYPDIKVIAITGFDNESDLYEMLMAGAKGIILKSSETNEVYRALDNVMNGGEYFCASSIPVIFRRIMNSSGGNAEKFYEGDFTNTEIRIIKEICRQNTSKEIADKLNLSEKTISYYRARLMEKMGVKSSIGIALFAVKNNIAHINELI